MTSEVRSTSEANNLALLRAAHTGSPSQFGAAITNGADLSYQHRGTEDTVVHAVAHATSPDVAVATQAIFGQDSQGRQASFVAENKNGLTALELAAKNGHLYLIEMMLDAAAAQDRPIQLHPRTPNGLSFMEMAPDSAKPEIVHAMIEFCEAKGIDADKELMELDREWWNQEKAIMSESEARPARTEPIEQDAPKIQSTHEVESVSGTSDMAGSTARLHHSIRNDDLEGCREAMRQGASIFLPDTRDGSTALHHLVRLRPDRVNFDAIGNLLTTTYLANQGSFKEVNGAGNNALHEAAVSNNIHAINLFLLHAGEMKVDVNLSARNGANLTVYDIGKTQRMREDLAQAIRGYCTATRQDAEIILGQSADVGARGGSSLLIPVVHTAFGDGTAVVTSPRASADNSHKASESSPQSQIPASTYQRPKYLFNYMDPKIHGGLPNTSTAYFQILDELEQTEPLDLEPRTEHSATERIAPELTARLMPLATNIFV